MRLSTLLSGALLLTLAFAPADVAAQSSMVLDDRGKAVELKRVPQRIISLAPNITELLFAVGAGPQLVAVSQYSDYPEAARLLPRVASALGADYERILALDPDLVIAWSSGNGTRVIQRLEALGIPLFVTEPRLFTDVERLLSLLGAITGHAQEGAAQAARFRQRVERLGRRFAHKASVSAFYQISQRPLMTVNGEHIISEVLRLCGGANAFAGYRTLAPVVTMEDVLERNAEIILISSTVPDVEAVKRRWLQLKDLTAARRNQVFVVDADLLDRQTPRLALGAETVCRLLNGARTQRSSHSRDQKTSG